MSWEHASEARAALNAIVTDPEHGVAALSSAQTMSNLLKDLLPDAPREKSILVAAAEAGLANTLRQHVDQGMDPDTAIRLTSSSFSSTTPFTPEACGWVTGEIATALGMSHSGTAGGIGGTPAGFDPIGQQGMPTRIAPVPGAGYTPGQAPTQGFPATPGQGGASGFGAGAQPTTPGPWQPGGGQQGGGFGQGQPPGGQPGGGFGQGQPPGGGYGGQPGAGYQGQPGGGFGGQPGQPAVGGWQAPGPGQPGGFGQGQPPAGYAGQPAGGWQPAGGAYGPTGPIIPGGPGGPIKPRGGKRGLLIAGGLVVALIVVVVVAVSLSGGGGDGGGHSSSPAISPTSPTTQPSSTAPVASGPEPLTTIMNPAGLKPVGTQCQSAKTFGLNKPTLTNSTFCAHTQRANIVVWGYQFDSAAHYQAGLAHINHFVGFDKVTPGSGCPPPSGSTEGKIGWHANKNPKYVSRTGQDIECLIDGNKPVLIWSMPTQNVFFIGQDNATGTSINTILNWWKILNYG